MFWFGGSSHGKRAVEKRGRDTPEKESRTHKRYKDNLKMYHALKPKTLPYVK